MKKGTKKRPVANWRAKHDTPVPGSKQSRLAFDLRHMKSPKVKYITSFDLSDPMAISKQIPFTYCSHCGMVTSSIKEHA